MISSRYSLENGYVEQNSPAGDAVLDALLEVAFPVGFQGTLLFCAETAANQHLHIPSYKAAVQLLFSLLILGPSVTSSQVQNPIFGLANYHAINDCPRLQSI